MMDGQAVMKPPPAPFRDDLPGDAAIGPHKLPGSPKKTKKKPATSSAGVEGRVSSPVAPSTPRGKKPTSAPTPAIDEEKRLLAKSGATTRGKARVLDLTESR